MLFCLGGHTVWCECVLIEANIGRYINNVNTYPINTAAENWVHILLRLLKSILSTAENSAYS